MAFGFQPQQQTGDQSFEHVAAQGRLIIRVHGWKRGGKIRTVNGPLQVIGGQFVTSYGDQDLLSLGEAI
ncbi:hypothetical protein JCM17960_29710 [Magnetospira thiophila]